MPDLPPVPDGLADRLRPVVRDCLQNCPPWWLVSEATEHVVAAVAAALASPPPAGDEYHYAVRCPDGTVGKPMNYLSDAEGEAAEADRTHDAVVCTEPHKAVKRPNVWTAVTPSTKPGRRDTAGSIALDWLRVALGNGQFTAAQTAGLREVQSEIVRLRDRVATLEALAASPPAAPTPAEQVAQWLDAEAARWEAKTNPSDCNVVAYRALARRFREGHCPALAPPAAPTGEPDESVPCPECPHLSGVHLLVPTQLGATCSVSGCPCTYDLAATLPDAGQRPRQVQTACDRCTQGVMDADNPHLTGRCSCSCHAAPAPSGETAARAKALLAGVIFREWGDNYLRERECERFAADLAAALASAGLLSSPAQTPEPGLRAVVERACADVEPEPHEVNYEEDNDAAGRRHAVEAIRAALATSPAQTPEPDAVRTVEYRVGYRRVYEPPRYLGPFADLAKAVEHEAGCDHTGWTAWIERQVTTTAVVPWHPFDPSAPDAALAASPAQTDPPAVHWAALREELWSPWCSGTAGWDAPLTVTAEQVTCPVCRAGRVTGERSSAPAQADGERV